MRRPEPEPTEKHLGRCGRMLSGSKSHYCETYPDHLVVFNSNVCTKEDGKVWFGDLDITEDESKLIALANELNKTLFVLYEIDARFRNESNPKFEKFILMVTPDGSLELGNDQKNNYERVGSKFLEKNL